MCVCEREKEKSKSNAKLKKDFKAFAESSLSLFN